MMPNTFWSNIQETKNNNNSNNDNSIKKYLFIIDLFNHDAVIQNNCSIIVS